MLFLSMSLVSLQRSARVEKPWDELIFAQTWPASFCVQIGIQVSGYWYNGNLVLER